MIDLDALTADLQVVASIEKSILVKQKSLCDRLNDKKLDEVIHELFSRDDILKFLSEASVPVGVATNKDILTKAVKEAVNGYRDDVDNFQTFLSDGLTDLEHESLQQEGGKILEKYGIQFDEENSCFAPGTDPKVVELFGSFSSSSGTDISWDSKGCSIEINHPYTDIQNPITTKIEAGDLDVWVAEHFLVKDVEGQPGMATFELIY